MKNNKQAKLTTKNVPLMIAAAPSPVIPVSVTQATDAHVADLVAQATVGTAEEIAAAAKAVTAADLDHQAATVAFAAAEAALGAAAPGDYSVLDTCDAACDGLERARVALEFAWSEHTRLSALVADVTPAPGRDGADKLPVIITGTPLDTDLTIGDAIAGDYQPIARPDPTTLRARTARLLEISGRYMGAATHAADAAANHGATLARPHKASASAAMLAMAQAKVAGLANIAADAQAAADSLLLTTCRSLVGTWKAGKYTTRGYGALASVLTATGGDPLVFGPGSFQDDLLALASLVKRGAAPKVAEIPEVTKEGRIGAAARATERDDRQAIYDGLYQATCDGAREALPRIHAWLASQAPAAE